MRKIIHVDMDCFYAAIEIRDRPELKNLPVAIGSHHPRGVLCTANYVAREYGVRSAMPNATAYRHCPNLVLLPIDMPKYKAASKRIQAIFREYTNLVEPLALDEAFLDVTESTHHQGSATRIAEAIRQRIWTEEQLTASAGVAPNKFLAKIGSSWNKPNGLTVIRPQDVDRFVVDLPVEKLFGVGKVTAKKFYQLKLKTCRDLQQLSLTQLMQHFGKLGEHFYEQCRGMDSRAVNPNRLRKSLSVEQTFAEDIQDPEQCLEILKELHVKLLKRLQESCPNQHIKSQFIKIKLNDFKLLSAETASLDTHLEQYIKLFLNTHNRQPQPIRLLGMGVSFQDSNTDAEIQGNLF